MDANQDDSIEVNAPGDSFIASKTCMRLYNSITHIIIIRTYMYMYAMLCMCVYSIRKEGIKNRAINVQLNGVIDQSMRIVMEFSI